jgi:HSP20 family protein
MLRSEFPSSFWDISTQGPCAPYDTSRSYPYGISRTTGGYPFSTMGPGFEDVIGDVLAPVEQIFSSELGAPSVYSPRRRRGRALYPEEVKATAASQMRPHMDIVELQDSYCYCFELPGVCRKEDINLNVENNMLRIHAQKPEILDSVTEPITTWGGVGQARSKSGDFHRRERPWGTYRRTVRLPPNVDPSKITCSYDLNGVLSVRIGKIGEASQSIGRKLQIT